MLFSIPGGIGSSTGFSDVIIRALPAVTVTIEGGGGGMGRPVMKGMAPKIQYLCGFHLIYQFGFSLT